MQHKEQLSSKHKLCNSQAIHMMHYFAKITVTRYKSRQKANMLSASRSINTD